MWRITSRFRRLSRISPASSGNSGRGGSRATPIAFSICLPNGESRRRFSPWAGWRSGIPIWSAAWWPRGMSWPATATRTSGRRSRPRRNSGRMSPAPRHCWKIWAGWKCRVIAPPVIPSVPAISGRWRSWSRPAIATVPASIRSATICTGCRKRRVLPFDRTMPRPCWKCR